MNCDDPAVFIGAGVNFENPDLINVRIIEWPLYLRTGERFICAIFLIGIIALLSMMHCGCKKKIKYHFDFLMKYSVFSFLDNLEPPENIEQKQNLAINSVNSDQIKIKIVEKNDKLSKETNNKKQVYVDTTSVPSFDFEEAEGNRNMQMIMNKETLIDCTSEEIYICNFHDCCFTCFSCFCNKNMHEKYVTPCISSLRKEFNLIYWPNLKFICFYLLIIGSFIFNSFRELFSIAFNVCSMEYMDVFLLDFFKIIFFFADIFCGAISITALIFVISYINTRKELLRIYYFKKFFRAKLMYYHLNKGIKIGILFFLLKFSFKTVLLFQYDCYDMMESPYSVVWIIFKNLFLLSIIKYNNSFTHDSIEEDCLYQRAHAKYFAIQNNMLKKLPSAKNVYDLIKHMLKKQNKSNTSINNEEEMFFLLNRRERINLKVIENKMKIWCLIAKNELRTEIKIIENQKFKNILRNNGYLRYIPSVFLFILIVKNVMAIMNGFLLLTKYYFSYQFVKDYHYLVMGTVVSFLDCCVLPVLIFFCVKKSTIKKKN